MTRMPVSRARSLYLPVAVLIGVGLSVLVLQTLRPSSTDGEILNRAFLTDRLVRHLYLVGVSFAVVTVVGVPLGVLLAKSGRWLRVPVFLGANLGQAVPSVGILVLFYAFFGLGAKPALLALVIYALLPVLRNTVVGVQGVDPAAVEAARGMGMSARQVLLRVELPLALPVIVAGLRQATVMVVAIATIGATVGANDLGQPIFAAVGRSEGTFERLFSGMLPVAAIGILGDLALAAVQRGLARGRVVVAAT
jgi:osmoprotectant transport system permease protein